MSVQDNKQDQDKSCQVIIHALSGKSWQGIKENVESYLNISAEKSQFPVLSYTESLASCEIQQKTWDVLSFDEDQTLWQGRVFNHHFDLRWVRNPSNSNSSWQAWLTVEFCHTSMIDKVLTPQANIQYQAIRKEKKYYLNGLFKEEASDGIFIFTEMRYPDKEFKYPLPNKPKDKERAFLTVYEYERLMPKWEVVKDHEIQEYLDQPLLIAHRFVSLDFGQNIPQQQ